MRVREACMLLAIVLLFALGYIATRGTPHGVAPLAASPLPISAAAPAAQHLKGVARSLAQAQAQALAQAQVKIAHRSAREAAAQAQAQAQAQPKLAALFLCRAEERGCGLASSAQSSQSERQ